MLRPGGFPEYTPAEQRIFDTIVAILTKHFDKWNYQHIMTPAVEPVDILTRGGDIGDKQVYGLYGLAQGNEDTKDYALHFDLTVPFARYVLDHMNDLVFPFKRYQMQPVRRGERTKRGRYKEFWQFDIDTIWRTETDIGSWYDAESIIVCYQALQEIFSTCGIDKKVIVKVSNISLTKEILEKITGMQKDDGLVMLTSDQKNATLKLLDDYYKFKRDIFEEKLGSVINDTYIVKKILDIIDSKDPEIVNQYIGSSMYLSYLIDVLATLKKYNVNIEYDFAIIRGHNYYTGTVVEFFLEDDMDIGAIAGGGAYRGLTDFIDAKRSFSGVGCSISSRIMEIIISLGGGLKSQDESYMFINFEDTKDQILGLMQKFHQAGKKCELFPTAAKLGKQFEYADKKGVKYCVVYGAGEIEKNSYLIKDLKTGTSYEGFFDAAYGIIPICEIDGEKRVLMIKHNAGHRGFPKGHAEQGENALITAIRECQEEVGLQHMNVYQEKNITESYFIADPQKALPTTGVAPRNILKTITYFIAQVENPTMKIQPEEVADAQWLTLTEARELPMFAQMRGILHEVQKFL